MPAFPGAAVSVNLTGNLLVTPGAAPCPVVYTEFGEPPYGDAATVAAELVADGRTPGLRVGGTARQIADFLAVLAHADTGFVAQARSATEVISLLAATVAALRGDDVEAAYLSADIAALNRLSAGAVEAVRAVLLAVEVTDPAATLVDVHAAGL